MKKNTFARKTLSVVLSLLMLLSVLGVAASAYDVPEGFIPVPYTAAEALAAGEEGLYLYFDVLKLEGYDTATMTIDDYREIVAYASAEIPDDATEEEEAAALEAAAALVAEMSDEEVMAYFEEIMAEEIEMVKADLFGEIYFNPAIPEIILSNNGYTVELYPSDEPDWSQGVVYEEVYAGFNTAVPVFTPAVAEGEDEVDALDPSAIVVYAQADVNLLGATMTVAANVEITPEEIAKAESLPEMAGLAISKLTSFDISFSKDGENNLQPSAGADVTIRMPVPDGYDEEKIAVFHIDGEGAVQKVASTISNGFILAKAAFGFSPYFIAEVEEPTTDEAVEAAIAAIAAIGEVAYTDASKALIDAADAAYAALTDAQKANVTNAAVLAAAKTAYAELKAAAEATEPSTEEPTTEPATEPTKDNSKDFGSFLAKLFVFLTELFNMFTRWIKK